VAKDKKNLDDFLPKKNNVFFKSFKTSSNQEKILKEIVIDKMKTILDPEIPVNIYDLGLIYKLEIDDKNNIVVEMTLTTPNCPVAGSMPENIGNAISEIKGISSISVKLVWEPTWNKDMMSEDAKLALDIF
tara:strand:+ start:61 stop:453 length:393 start_codon:yes stop_codon:yes gene_type:complete